MIEKKFQFKKKVKFYLIHIILMIFVASYTFSQTSGTLRVGIYQNEPKIFIDAEGNPSGFWVELLNYIAEKEDWIVRYVPGTWEENLQCLKNNDIDILPDVAYNEDRKQVFDFNLESVYTSWSGIYAKSETNIESILDLEGKKLAVLQESINYIGNSGIKSLIQAFDIKCTFVEKSSYQDVFKAVKNGEVDAGVTSKDFAISNLSRYELISTPIIFQPATLYFAFPRDNEQNQQLIDAIDTEIKQLKAVETSFYYELMKKWFNVDSGNVVIPQWLFWLLSVAILFAVMLGVGTYILRKQVKQRTAALTEEIREREKFEEELNDSKRMLEKTVASRTAELKHSNEELERFAYITSHDLQEPLRMITSYLQLLESRYRDQIDSDANDFIFYAVDGAKRMQQLINDLLKYSRLDTQKKEFEEVDCNQLIKEVLNNLEIAIKESVAEIQVSTLPRVVGDDTQLRQLFQNLIGNALKFKADSSLLIKITAEEDENHWWISVKDNGIGIEEKYFERIFQVFQRLHGNRKYEGNGIGLAICKKIAENHGGNILVTSKMNEGSCFTVSISKKGGIYAEKNG